MDVGAVVLVVDSDILGRWRVGQWLRDRCGTAASVVEAADGREARQLADRLRVDGGAVAMVVIGAGVTDRSDLDPTGWAAAFPGATRVLLSEDADRAMGWDACLAGDDRAKLAPLLDGALAGVTATGSPPADVHVVGRRHGPLAYEIKDFLARNFIPFRWHDVDSSAHAARLATNLGLTDPVPTTVVLGERTVLREPSVVELAAALGLTEPVREQRCDLLIVGGGPAGLAAAVYGACEGLRVSVVEVNAPGGQAGSTSRIENYLGFPTGLSGTELAQRALVQARRFGARWLVGHRATGLAPDEQGFAVRLDDGSTVRSRTVLVATGMRWRRLDLPDADRFVNRGIYYGASLVEAAQTAGEDVYVVGAGNSAGQAALFLAEHARSVTVLVRGESLDAAPISRYLVERIEQTSAITVRTRTVIAEAAGGDGLESIVLRHTGSGATERVATGSVYVLIGMQPCTGWLPDTVARDSHGFVLTGAAAPTTTPAMITETSLSGVFAAGDVCAGTVKRVGAAVGQGAMAIQVIAQYLRSGLATQPAAARPVRQFDLLDADGNGYIEQQDLHAAATRLVSGFDEPAGSPRAQRVRSSYTEFWHTLAAIADTDGDHRITRTEFDTALHTMADQTPVFTAMAEAVVAVCDTDDDGQLNHAEFHKLLGALGVSIEDVNQLYQTLDADHSGYLDTTEIAEALRRFYAGAELLHTADSR